jgi:3-deoxy-D-manno-octulosonic-acid transferase
LGKVVYDLFLKVFSLAFKIAALFNTKARLGVQGRKNVFSLISANATTSSQQVVWMHCASLGEFEQGRPVLESLKQQYPHITIVLTFFSASGYEVMKNYKGADHIYYLPMDGSSNAKRMVDALNPTLVLWVKYEFWYYYLHELKNRNIPVLLISGIFWSKHSFFKWYGKIWRQMLLCFTHLFVQNENSKDLLATIGFPGNVSVTGDTRFDRVIEIAEKFEPLPLIKQFCGDSKVFVAGSTWEDDEAELTHYVRGNPQIKFIIAPHEIDASNLNDVKKEFPDSIFYSALANNQQLAINEQIKTPHVLIIDNVGMLSRLYQYADITYVGGGFGADGVHNVLEAAVYGKPVIYGPEYEKYSEAIGLVECGGGISIENALELESTLNQLWKDEKLLATKGNAAKDYVYANKGASKKIIQFIQEKRLLTS